METDGLHPLRADLTKLKVSADQLLGQIDAMAALGAAGEVEPAAGRDRLSSLTLLPMCCARWSRCPLADVIARRCIRADPRCR